MCSLFFSEKSKDLLIHYHTCSSNALASIERAHILLYERLKIALGWVRYGFSQSGSGAYRLCSIVPSLAYRCLCLASSNGLNNDLLCSCGLGVLCAKDLRVEQEGSRQRPQQRPETVADILQAVCRAIHPEDSTCLDFNSQHRLCHCQQPHWRLR